MHIIFIFYNVASEFLRNVEIHVVYATIFSDPRAFIHGHRLISYIVSAHISQYLLLKMVCIALNASYFTEDELINFYFICNITFHLNLSIYNC